MDICSQIFCDSSHGGYPAISWVTIGLARVAAVPFLRYPCFNPTFNSSFKPKFSGSKKLRAMIKGGITNSPTR
jgi:hypothetical protein